VEQGAIADMTQADGLRLRVGVSDNLEAFQAALRAASIQIESVTDDVLTILQTGEHEDADDILAIAADSAATITSLELVRATLEQVFLKAVRSNQNDGEALPA